jgi:hypothetical protein
MPRTKKRGVPEGVLALKYFPEAHQREIAAQVALPEPPARWIAYGGPDSGRPIAWMESRGWYEWHWQRGRYPGESRQSLSPRLRKAVIDRDGYLCGLCGGEVEPTDVHIDHIIPVFHGGKDRLENLQVAHSQCNLRKGRRLDGTNQVD